MTYILQFENKENFPKIKKLLEQIKGAKIFEVSNLESDFYEDGTPKEFINQLAVYTNSIKKEDWISEDDFIAYINSTILRRSPKSQ